MEQTLLVVPKQSTHKTINLSVFRDAILGFILSLTVGFASASLLIALVVLLSTDAKAADFPIDYDAIGQGTLYLNSQGQEQYEESMLLRTRVNVEINGLIARTKVTQMFTNQSDDWLEGIYVFPLPEQAAVDHMKMYVGDRVIEGQIHKKEDAKKIYEKAKQEGKTTTLAQQQRPNLFTTKVANVAPGDIIEIQIEYQQTLVFGIENGQGKISLRYPMTVTPRYAALKNNQNVSSDSKENLIVAKYNNSESNNLTSIDVNLKSGFEIANIVSGSHQIDTQFEDLSHVLVSLSQGQSSANQDFVLTWFIEAGNNFSTARFSEKVDNDFYHLIMVMPPTDGIAGVQPLAREIIVIIDTSGSMEGESLNQAKSALLAALEQLREFDTFNIIQFNSETHKLFAKAKFADYINLQKARNYVKSLQSGGGTEMYPALNAALEHTTGNGSVRQILFLTDGGVSNEKSLFELIHAKLGQNRLFTVAIGSAPNSYFMRKSAQFGRGTFTYIADTNDVEAKMQALFTKLESPVLSDLSIHFSDLQNVEYWPQNIPDLYLGEPLVLSIRTTSSSGNIQLMGRRANNQWTSDFDLTDKLNSEGLGVLWAREKIADLTDSVSEGADEEDVKQQIIATAMQHHLVSQYTSLVAVDLTPVRSEFDSLKRTQIANNIPKGFMQGQLPQTATPMQLFFAMGVTLLFTAIVFVLFREKMLQCLSHYTRSWLYCTRSVYRRGN